MSRNGSGTYSLPQPPFVPATPISSSAVNSDLSDIATALTGSVASDGQTTITGALKGYAGSVSFPGYSFSNDPDSGLYRIGSNNLGIAVGGTKIVDISSTGISVTGSLTPTDQFLAPDGTVALPEYSFASDPDSGLYRIGANNLGVAVNATKVLDISTSGLNVVGTVSQNGSALAQAAYATGIINGTIAESHTGNAVTFALKTAAGTDPSSTDQVTLLFRDVTATAGTYTTVQVTSALSVTVSSGSTLGAVSTVPFKVWGVLFNDGGTPRIGVMNTVSGTNIYPLGQFPIASSTAEGGVGGADSAQVFYTDSAVASKAYIPFFYASYESGLATAGSWAVSPTRLMIYGPNVPLPGTVIQPVINQTGAFVSGATAIPYDDTIPQITEGFQFLSQAITPTSAANILSINWQGLIAGNTSNYMGALFSDAGSTDALTVSIGAPGGTTGPLTLAGFYRILSSTTSARTFSVRIGNGVGSTVSFNGSSGARIMGGVANSYLKIDEVMT